MISKAPARIILLIALPISKNLTHLRLGTLNSSHNYFCGAIVTNVFAEKVAFHLKLRQRALPYLKVL